MGKRNKPTLTKHDIVRSIKELENRINFVANHMRMLDDVLDKYIRMNKDQDKLTKFIEKEVKANEHKQEKRKQSGKSSTPSE